MNQKIRNYPAIVLPCYNRPRSLRRLLDSISRASFSEFSGKIPLIFSIDYSGSNETYNVAKSFLWRHGSKDIIRHQKNIGLRNNILSCGNLTQKYSSVIILEDDLVVASDFYLYAKSSKEFYENDKRIAQISLYAYEYDEISCFRFIPSCEGYCTFFMQWASSWGQLWTKETWDCFRRWYDKNKDQPISGSKLPLNVQRWPNSSWKKFFIKYLVETDKYSVFPYLSRTTVFGDAGSNTKNHTQPIYQTPLALGNKAEYHFAPFVSSSIKYDSYFEPGKDFLNRINPDLSKYDYGVDFHGHRPLPTIKSEFLLSTKRCQNPILSFSWNLQPFEQNIANQIPGYEISFGKTKDFVNKNKIKHKVRKALWSQQLLSPKRSLFYSILRIFTNEFRKINEK